MFRKVFVAMLFIVLTTLAHAEDHWPSQVPQSLSGWTFESSGGGQKAVLLEMPNVQLEYTLYSSPKDAMYDLSNYQLHAKSMTGWFAGRATRYHGYEVVVWSENLPKVSNRIFVRSPHRSWRSLKIIRHWRWKELSVGSPEWKFEQTIVLRIWSVHALVNNHDKDPMSLTF